MDFGMPGTTAWPPWPEKIELVSDGTSTMPMQNVAITATAWSPYTPYSADVIVGVRGVRTQSRRRDRDVLHGHRACPVAHQLDLLWPGRPSRGPWHSKVHSHAFLREGSHH